MDGYPVDLLHAGLYVSTSNPLPVSASFPSIGTSNALPVSVQFAPTQMDAFGRLRFSQPVTLFDSFYRYSENTKFKYYTSNGGSYTFNSNEGCIGMRTGTGAGSLIYRESSRVFSYQPGKSLLVLETFSFHPLTNGLQQRIGYFDTSNGIYFQADGSNLSMVRRSGTSGSIINTVVPQNEWNYDKLNGTGISGITLEPSRAQILFIDIEWLGVGTVRSGFIIDGIYRLCHLFHYANQVGSILPYMTTASLPIRAELENKTSQPAPTRMNVICSSVISEGGYELRGKPRGAGWSLLDVPYTLASKNTFYPVMAIQLKVDRMGAVVVLEAISLVSITVSVYRWALISEGSVNGGTWISVSDDSSVEYNISGTSITGGFIIKQGLFSATGPNSPQISLDSTLFRFQLERNTFTNTTIPIVLAVSSDNANNKVVATMDWQELT
jgi:hypothetical protein